MDLEVEDDDNTARTPLTYLLVDLFFDPMRAALPFNDLLSDLWLFDEAALFGSGGGPNELKFMVENNVETVSSVD